MAIFERGEIKLHYQVHGEGFPVLLLAPGGMRSAADLWRRAPFDPRELLKDEFQLIAMDQRNAGQSSAPVSPADGWSTYMRDQLALLDHLQVERCHVLGMCIGGPFGLGLMRAAPERIAAGVLMQPIGYDDNRDAFYEMFDSWAAEMQSRWPQVETGGWQAMRSNLFDGDFLFNMGPDQVRELHTPMLVLRGDDLYHPAVISEQLAELAPQATLIRDWKTGDALGAAQEAVLQFLRRHS